MVPGAHALCVCEWVGSGEHKMAQNQQNERVRLSPIPPLRTQPCLQRKANWGNWRNEGTPLSSWLQASLYWEPKWLLGAVALV